MTLKDGKGQFCWNHEIKGFQFEFSSPSTGMGGMFFIGSASSPIGTTQADHDIQSIRSKLKQKSRVYSTTQAMIYDMNYDFVVTSDHYGCCYDIHYEKDETIIYSRLMNLKLSQCTLDEQLRGSTLFSYNLQCEQLKSILSQSQSRSSSEFIYIGDGGCRDEDNLAPSRYWHDKLEFHSCQLQCIQDSTCLGIMYFHNGRWKGRCLIYTFSMSLLQLYQDGNVIPHQGWKWIESDPSPIFDHTQRNIVQALGSVGSGRCFAKRKLSPGESMKSFITPKHDISVRKDDKDEDDEKDAAEQSEMTIRISELNQQDPLALPWR